MITTQHTTNIDAVLASVRASVPSDHVLEVRNTAEYARYLHDKEGYSVLNDGVLQGAANEAIAKRLDARIRRGEAVADADIVEALEEAAVATVDFYQSAIGTKSTRGKVKLPPRLKHPGEWADDTERLASSYQSRVDGGEYKHHPYD